MTLVDTSWVEDLVDELGPDGVPKYDSEPLLALLSKLAGDTGPQPTAVKAVEVGDPVPDTKQDLGDFSPGGGGI